MDRNDCLVFVTSFLMLVWLCAAAARVPTEALADQEMADRAGQEGAAIVSANAG